MIKLTNAKNNKRLNEFDDFKEYVIQKNIDVKKVKNQEVIGDKITDKCLSARVSDIKEIRGINENSQEKMLFYFF